MTVYAFASAKGSPGVTSSVLAMAALWPAVTARKVLVVDADLAGSGILPGYLRASKQPGHGLLQLAAERTDALANEVLAASVRLHRSGDVLLLTGLTDPAQAAALTVVWSSLVGALNDLDADGMDVLVDAGRVAGGAAALDTLTTEAFQRLLVTRSSLVSLASVNPFLERTEEATNCWRLLLVGPGRPYTANEVAKAIGRTEPVLELPWDPATAATFSDGAAPKWGHDRSPLMRGARALILQLLEPAAADTAPANDPTTEPAASSDSVATAVAR